MCIIKDFKNILTQWPKKCYTKDNNYLLIVMICAFDYSLIIAQIKTVFYAESKIFLETNSAMNFVSSVMNFLSSVIFFSLRDFHFLNKQNVACKII